MACATAQKKTAMIKGKILVHLPYCGGAKPSKEIVKGKNVPYKSAVFYVKSSMNNDLKKQTISKIETDINGEFTLNIPQGKYFIIHEDKTLSFEKYLLKYNIPKPNYEFIGEKEAKIIFETADFEFVVEENKPIEIIYQSKCFVGMNRCLKYTGPLPQ